MTISYVDEDADYASRQEDLACVAKPSPGTPLPALTTTITAADGAPRDYGFACRCRKCELQRADA